MRFVIGLLPLLIAGCAAEAPKTVDTPKTEPAAAAPAAQETPAATQEPAKKDVPVDQLINADGKIDAGLPKTASPGAKMPKDGDDIAIITTNQGRIVVKFFPEKAPNHVKNFLDLAGSKFYDGTKFHRVIPGFMIQGGDPNTKSGAPETWGMGGPDKRVNAEFNDVPHTPGILSMARSGDPNSGGSQFFIMHAAYPSLNGQYSVFGQVIEGMDIVDKIAKTPTGAQDRPTTNMVIEKVEAVKWPVKLNG